MLVGVGGLVEGEDAVDDGFDFGLGDGAGHVFEHFGGADVDALEVGAFHHHGEGIGVGLPAGDQADQGDLAFVGYGFVGFGESAGAADFDDVIDAAFAGQLGDFFLPVRDFFVVDAFVGAEFFGAG